MNDPMIGREISNCTITEKLGQGGMAVVYRAHQASVNRDVAIKILTGPLALDQEFVSRFRREAMAAGGLGHPNILTIYDAGTTPDGLHYIVMEYAPGGTLKDLLDRGPLRPDQAREIAAQLADALGAAHEHGIVHRDLKPSNILFSRDGRPLLMDFGVALTAAGARLTRTGMAVGTPEYMSPEQAQGLSVDGRSDIYSLGIMLFEMLTGTVPFVGDTPLATLYQHVHNTLSTGRLRDQGVPGWLAAVVERSLAKDPQDRYPSALEMAAVLRGERAAAPPPQPPRTEVRAERVPPEPLPPPAHLVPAPEPRRRGRPVLWAILAVVGVAAAIVVTYMVFFRPKAEPWMPPDVTDQPTAIVMATDTPVPPPDDSPALTATTVAALQATTEARATELANDSAASTRTAGEATATSVALTAEAQAEETREAQAGQSAATATAQAQATEVAVATEAVAATAFAVATEAAAATEVAGATATAQAQATATPEPATATAIAVATYVAGLTATVQAQTTPTEPPPITATPAPAAILFHRQESGQDDVFVRSGTQEANLTQNPSRDYAAAWSPDGQSIVFVSDRSGNPDIWVMNADGSNPRNLTNDGGFDSAPAWSPGGQWIAFHSARTGLFQIWAVRSDGSEQRQLIQSGQQDYNPEWSPDGSRIAFYRTVEGDNYEIMVANTDGSDVQRLTFEPGWDYVPMWTADSSQIVFKSRREGGDADRFYQMNRDGSNVQRLQGSIAVFDKTRYPGTGTISQ